MTPLILSLIIFSQNPVGGYLRFETFSRLDSVQTLYKVATTFQLNVTLETDNARAFGSTNFIYDRLIDNLIIRPLELYITLSRGPVDLTAGKKILTWGPGVFVSPSDFINPWDFSVIYSDLEEFRVGIESVLLSAFSNNSFVTLGFIPIFQPNQYPMPSFSQIMPMGPDTFIYNFYGNKKSLPEKDLSNAEVFLVLGTTLGSADLRVYAFKGFDRDPDIAISQRPSDTIDLSLAYSPIKVFGSFGSAVSGPWELHYDIAYFKTSESITNLKIKKPYIYGCVGFTRALMDNNLTVGFDYLAKKVNLEEKVYNPMDSFLNEFLRQISFQEYDFSSYGAFRLSVAPEKSNLGITLSGIYDFRSREAFTMIIGTYNWADAVNLRAGAILSGKKGRSPFTQMGKHLGQLGYFEVRFNF